MHYSNDMPSKHCHQILKYWEREREREKEREREREREKEREGKWREERGWNEKDKGQN